MADFPTSSHFPVLKAILAIDDGSIGMGVEPALCLGQMQVDGSGLTVGNQQFPDVLHLLARLLCRFKLLQRDAKLNYLTWEWQDLVEGHIVQLTNADQSRTFAWIGMHQHKLYIVEGTVPPGYPEPGLFQQSMQWIDKDGKGIRYQTLYSNSFHAFGIYPLPGIVGR